MDCNESRVKFCEHNTRFLCLLVVSKWQLGFGGRCQTEHPIEIRQLANAACTWLRKGPVQALLGSGGAAAIKEILVKKWSSRLLGYFAK